MKDIKIHPDLQMRRIKNAELKCREATSDWGKNHWYNTFKALCEKMRKGLVDNLIILGGNPVYDAPADYNFEECLSNVKSSVHLSDFYDETSKHCQWNIAQAHFFEAWGDAMTYDGYASVIQPQIRQLFDSRSALQVLTPVIFKEDRIPIKFS